MHIQLTATQEEEDDKEDAESKRIRRLSRAAQANPPPLPIEVQRLLARVDFKGTTPGESQISVPILILEKLAELVRHPAAHRLAMNK